MEAVALPPGPPLPRWLHTAGLIFARGGTRRCLGASFATFEMRVLVRRVVQRTPPAPA